MRREVVMMVWCAWVLPGGSVRNGEEIVRKNHSSGNTGAELLYLAADVVEEGIAGPPADEHDGVYWDPC
jgi:hypothetical protein